MYIIINQQHDDSTLVNIVLKQSQIVHSTYNHPYPSHTHTHTHTHLFFFFPFFYGKLSFIPPYFQPPHRASRPNHTATPTPPPSHSSTNHHTPHAYLCITHTTSCSTRGYFYLYFFFFYTVPLTAHYYTKTTP